MDETLPGIWQSAVTAIRASIGPADAMLLDRVQPLDNVDGTVLVVAPNDLVRRIIENRIGDKLTHALSQELGSPARIAVTVDPDGQSQRPEDGVDVPPVGAAVPGPAVMDDAVEELLPPAPVQDSPTIIPAPDTAPVSSADLNPAYTFDTFVPGPSNRFAHAAALAVAESPAGSYNPLFIYGGSGLGKTHLLHAIGHYAPTLNPNLRVLYVSSEKFTNDFIYAIREKRGNEQFQNRYREVDILLIDDIQFIQGKKETMEEFFHTFNALQNAGKQIVLTSDVPPNELTGLEERLISRFASGLVVDVQPPALETRIAILQKKAEADGAEINHDVLEYIATRVTTNIRELEGALIRVTAYANLTKEPVELPVTELVLKDIIPDDENTEITPPLIMAQTAAYFGISVDELLSSNRARHLVRPRHIAMYLCRELTDLPLKKIAEAFGRRDHTTVINANNNIKDGMPEDRDMFNQVSELTNRIKNAAREQ